MFTSLTVFLLCVLILASGLALGYLIGASRKVRANPESRVYFRVRNRSYCVYGRAASCQVAANILPGSTLHS